jgi:hypothetical protein
VGLPGFTAEWGALWLTPPWLWVFVYAPRIHSVLSGWLVQSGLGRFPVAPEGFNAVLGQLVRWFYPFGSGAHCNNYYGRCLRTVLDGLYGVSASCQPNGSSTVLCGGKENFDEFCRL